MTTFDGTGLRERGESATRILKGSAVAWFAVAAAGQYFFAYYILVFYGGTAIAGDWAAWTRRLIVGFVEADLIGNLNLVAHMLLAFLITAAGPLQFVPQIRRRFPIFHRWTGRVYVTVAVLISLGALYLVWARGMAGLIPGIGISINGVLIIVCAVFAVRAVLARRIAEHQRWALRLFVMASGVWFFRIGFGFWFVVTEGAMPGVGPMLDGPFDYFLIFGNYLVPLAVLEIYQYARDRGAPSVKLAASGLVAAGAVVTAIGIFGAAQMFWLPRL